MKMRELVERTRVSKATIEHYRIRGLLKASRTPTGRWDYDEDSPDLLVLIHRKLTPLGINLDTIRTLLGVSSPREIEDKLTQLPAAEFRAWIDQVSDKLYLRAYNQHPGWANWQQQVKRFKERTGIFIPFDTKNSGQTLTALVAEKANPVADASYFGVTFGIEAARRGVAEGYVPPTGGSLPPELRDAEWRWVTVHYGTITFTVNKKALRGHPIPRSWRDLLKPVYRGMVGFLDPASTFAGFAAMLAANLALGGTLEDWNPGFRYLKRLLRASPTILKQIAYARVLRGEIPIMIDYDFNAYRLKYEEGLDAEVMMPVEGSLIVPYVVSLVKGARHRANAQKWIDYLLSDEGQRLFAEGYVRPVRLDATPADVLERFLPDSEYRRARTVNYAAMAESQQIFRDRWIETVRP